jgi:uridine phosphorylase
LAHPEVLLSLIQAADEEGLAYHVGITATAPGFYGAQGRHLKGFPPRHPDIVKELERQGIKNLEMETSCLLTMASLGGFRAGAVCAVLARRRQRSFISATGQAAAEGRCVGVGLRAFHNLARLDRERGARPHWHPGLRPGSGGR